MSVSHALVIICLHVYVSYETEPLEVYVPTISIFLVLSNSPGTHKESTSINLTHTEHRARLMRSRVQVPIPLPDFSDK